MYERRSISILIHISTLLFAERIETVILLLAGYRNFSSSWCGSPADSLQILSFFLTITKPSTGPLPVRLFGSMEVSLKTVTSKSNSEKHLINGRGGRLWQRQAVQILLGRSVNISNFLPYITFRSPLSFPLRFHSSYILSTSPLLLPFGSKTYLPPCGTYSLMSLV